MHNTNKMLNVEAAEYRGVLLLAFWSLDWACDTFVLSKLTGIRLSLTKK